MATDRFNSFGAAGEPFYAVDFSLFEVVGQYDSFFNLGLTDEEKRDLIEGLFGSPPRGETMPDHNHGRW